MAPVLYPSLQRDRPSQGVLSIRGYMMLLIAAILLPMLTLVAIVAWEYGTAARHTIGHYVFPAIMGALAPAIPQSAVTESGMIDVFNVIG